MEEALQAQLAALRSEVGAAAISDSCKQTAVWCLGQLPNLYTLLRQTSESRHFDAINRLVQGMLKELAKSQRACPESRKLAVRMTERLQFLHEEFGLPRLNLTPVRASSPRSRGKAIGKRE